MGGRFALGPDGWQSPRTTRQWEGFRKRDRHNWWENGGEDTVKDWWKNGTSLPVDNGDSDDPNSAAWANQFNPPEIWDAR